MRRSLLILEDDARFRETLKAEFAERGYEVYEGESTGRVDFSTISELSFAIVDLRLGGSSGLDEIKIILGRFPRCRLLMLTGYGSIATAVEAIKLGATNYLSKPASIQDIEMALWIDGEQGQAPVIEDSQYGESLARHEREYIEFVIQQCNGNISQAAKWLGIHRQSLQRKLRKYTPK